MNHTLDVNEYLFLNKLHTLLQTSGQKAIDLHALQLQLEFNEAFFLATLKPLEKKKLVTIGFFKRAQTIRVLNWAEKYSANQNLQIALTKPGRQALQSW